jgi:hypothetical protein
MPVDDSARLRAILSRARRIAVFGHSDSPARDSYRIAAYLRRAGYTVYPVNPLHAVVGGERCYPDLASLPETVEIVDVFRRPDGVPDAVAQTLALSARQTASGAPAPVLWLQLGVWHAAAVARAEAAGLSVVAERCIMVEHRELLGPFAHRGSA